MMNRKQVFMQWVMLSGLAGILVMEGCATRSLVVSSSGVEELRAQAGPSATAKVEPGVSAPLNGFAKAPAEEAVKPPASVEVTKAEPQNISSQKRELLDIYFAFDRWSLSPEGKKGLAQNAEALKQEPSAKLLIEGHCDERGTREYNLVLGEKRAMETRRYLQALGVANAVSVTSFGKERPVCTEQDESCYWKNRRAHLVIEGK